MKLSRILLLLVLLGVIGAAIAGYVIFLAPNDFGADAERTVFVRRGQPFTHVVDSLDARGIIRDRRMFKIVAKALGGSEKVQAGKYRFVSGTSNLDIYIALRDGNANQLVKVSIPEGARPRLQARLFARAIGIDSARYVNLAYDPEVARDYKIEGASLEGYLLPETYVLRWGMDERELIDMQLRAFRTFFTDSLEERARQLGWSVHQV